MFVSPVILLLLAVAAWGTAFFELSVDIHVATADLCGLEPYSSAAFQRERVVELATLLGLLVGFVLFGILSDRFGRYRLVLWCLVLGPALSGLTALSLSIVDFVLLRFLMGAALGGSLVSLTVLLFEAGRSPVYRKWLAIAVVAVLPAVEFLVCIRPEWAWRLSMPVTALPALFVLFFRRYRDESRPWKIAVRDADAKEKKLVGRLFNLRNRNRLAGGILLSTALFAGLYGVTSVGSMRLRDSIRYENFAGAGREDRREDAALIAFLVRYPQVLETKEIAPLDLEALPEKLYPTSGRLPEFLFEGILALRSDKRSINPTNVIDRALGCWNEHYGGDRPASAIPPEEIEFFWKQAEDYLREADAESDADKLFSNKKDGLVSGADLWERRKTVLKQLLSELQQRLEQRQRTGNRLMGLFKIRFLIGGLFGLLLWRRSTKRFGIRNMFIAFSLACAGVSMGFLFFSPSPEVTEYAGLGVFMTILGFCVVPFLAGGCVLLPRIFPTSIRSTGTGFAAAIAGLVAMTVFYDPAAFPAAAAVPPCFALGLPPLIGFRTK